MLHLCTPPRGTDGERLRALHETVSPKLLFKELYVPQHTISHTEDLACEYRRWENRATANRGRKRQPGMTRAVNAQHVRKVRLLKFSKTLGFKTKMHPPAIFLDIAVARARACAVGA